MIIHFFTIVKDGMPFIAHHYATMRRLNLEWSWTVVEGTAAPDKDTSWCSSSTPGLSTDGTTQYLDSLTAFDRRVRHLKHAWWHGKVAMCNAACELIQEPGLLWQIDADELWTTDQIQFMVRMFKEDKTKNSARFFCRYFVGPDIIISTRNSYGNRTDIEWNRAWKVQPGVRFKTHEPPVLEKFEEKPFLHKQTENCGLIFDHFSWATERQVKEKQAYYGSSNNKRGSLYANALDGWKRLQENVKWPARLQNYFPWVDEKAMCERIVDSPLKS